jgi:pimeloyl-ACP methyl ester carboxylesterase
MAPVARVLAKHIGVIEPYQTGHSIADQTEELRDAIDRHCRAPVVLIGFSWGAWLSILVASKFPELAEKLILIGCPPLEAAHAGKIPETRLSRLDEEQKAAFLSLLDDLNKDDTGASEKTLRKLDRMVQKTDSFDPEDEYEDTVMPDPGLFRKIWAEAAELRNKGVFVQALHAIKVPVIGIHGDYDPHPAEGIRDYLQDPGKDREFTILEHCGHKPWTERRAGREFYELLLSHIPAR